MGGAFLGCMYDLLRTADLQQDHWQLVSRNGKMDRTCKGLWLQTLNHVGMPVGRTCKTDVEKKALVDSYSLSVARNPRDALYGIRCETFALHDLSTYRFVIKYVDVQSLYPYVCKNKHYPVGHHRCLIESNL